MRRPEWIDMVAGRIAAAPGKVRPMQHPVFDHRPAVGIDAALARMSPATRDRSMRCAGSGASIAALATA